MPRKKTTSAEAEPAAKIVAQELTPTGNPSTEPGDDIPKPRRKTASKASENPPAKKRARTSAKKTAKTAAELEPAVADVAATSEAPQPCEAEAAAHAADTFDEAFGANDSPETRTSTEAAAAAREPDGEPEEIEDAAPEQEPDEADELEGDWESGSGDQDEEKPAPPPARQERLQKILAAAGVASRRHAEQLIVEGRVQVNGQVVTTLGTKADPARDHIRVDGKLIHGAERLRYFVLNKPRGYVTTVSDPEGRPTVMQFFARMGERLYPVGRLDYQSEGLLLMTNDGELANKLTRASSNVEKVYLVKVSGQPDADKIEALREGVRIDRGRKGEGRIETAPARIRQIRQGENPWFEVGLIEGRNRELRKMFEEIGHHVEKIRRVGYGPLELDVEPGKMRELTHEEVQRLHLAAEGKLKPKRVRASAMLPKEAGRTVDPEAGRRRGERPAGAQNRRPNAGGPPRSFSGGQRKGAKPEPSFPPRRERDTGQDRTGTERGAFRPREDRPARWQNRGQDRGQDRRQGPRQDRRPPRQERGRFEGERSGQRPPFGQRPAFGGKPQRFEGPAGESQDFQRGANRGFGRTAPPAGQRPFRGKPPEGENQRPRTARPPREGGFQDRGPRPPRFERASQDRPTFKRPPARSFERPPRDGEDRGSRPPRFERAGQDRPSFKRGPERSFERPPRTEDRPSRGGPTGGGERRSTPSRSGGFAKRGPGSGPKPGVGPRFGSKPGGGSRPGRGKPHGAGGRKPGGFGKGRPR